jgi:hypothetical protein
MCRSCRCKDNRQRKQNATGQVIQHVEDVVAENEGMDLPDLQQNERPRELVVPSTSVKAEEEEDLWMVNPLASLVKEEGQGEANPIQSPCGS